MSPDMLQSMLALITSFQTRAKSLEWDERSASIIDALITKYVGRVVLAESIFIKPHTV